MFSICGQDANGPRGFRRACCIRTSDTRSAKTVPYKQPVCHKLYLRAAMSRNLSGRFGLVEMCFLQQGDKSRVRAHEIQFGIVFQEKRCGSALVLILFQGFEGVLAIADSRVDPGL
jgi:hypothetical protein